MDPTDPPTTDLTLVSLDDLRKQDPVQHTAALNNASTDLVTYLRAHFMDAHDATQVAMIAAAFMTACNWKVDLTNPLQPTAAEWFVNFARETYRATEASVQHPES